jgi:hypothetical protein
LCRNRKTVSSRNRFHIFFGIGDFHHVFEKWAIIKKRIWANEEEWRFLFTDCNSYNPIFKTGDISVRQKKYNDDAISKVILGYKFFNDQVISNRKHKISENTFKYEFVGNDNKYKWDILIYLNEKGIDISQVVLGGDLRLFNQKIQILSMEKSEVDIYYIPVY